MVFKKNEPPRKAKDPSPVPTTICYCEGERELGTLELHCAGCRKWFHQRCLKNLTEFYGLPFMVCYVFKCQACSPSKEETWTPKQTNFAHMCVMALANMMLDHYSKLTNDPKQIAQMCLEKSLYFNLERDIVPYFSDNWESLTNIPRRVKNSWHQTLHKTLVKESELFSAATDDETSFCLNERNLLLIGPLHDSIRKLGKRPPASQPIPTADVSDKDEDSGPKTRGAAKRRAESSSRTSSATPTKASTPSSSVIDGPTTSKTSTNERGMGTLKRGTLDSNAVVEGSENGVNFPFNREGNQYFFTEKDVHAVGHNDFDGVDPEYADRVPAHIYRWKVPSVVQLSTNDRANQLVLEGDHLTLTGDGGYAVARATHCVRYGRWYYEVTFVKQPNESHVRIGWGQKYAHLQACVGYSKLSYGWRSLKGTKFHDACGRTYFLDGYQEGDVLGCLIELPEREEAEFKSWLPETHKDSKMLNFKGRMFFEEKEYVEEAIRNLRVLPGAKITFFKNGVSCGVAFSDIYEGAYYPVLSIFESATLKANFGPTFQYPPPPGARAMCERAAETEVELALADVVFHAEHQESYAQRIQDTKTYLSYCTRS